MKIQLSEHFTFKKILRFVFPSILMMVFISIYSVVDGIFVSNFVGKTPFAAVNLIMPFLMCLASGGFMMGTGGSALVAMYLGAGKHEKAVKIFSMLIYFTLSFSVLISTIAFIFMEKIVRLLGADGELLKNATLYGRIVVCGGPAFVLQSLMQSFLVVAERPHMGLVLTVSAGVTNMILDAVFIVGFGFGLKGAALATVLGQCVGGIIPLVFFIVPNKSPLRLGRAEMDFVSLFKSMGNGISELVGNISVSIVSIIYNFQLIKIAGETGIAAYGALMYVSFVFSAVFFGYGIGRSPIVSYHYGAENYDELKNVFKKDCVIICSASVILFVLSEALAVPFAKLFGGYDNVLFEMIKRAFILYSFSYLLLGANLSISSFFTALNNGLVSGIVSFVHTFVFQCILIMILPRLIGTDGIWLSGVVSEFFSLISALSFLVALRKKYRYW